MSDTKTVDVRAVLDDAAFRAGLGADKTDYNRLVDARAALSKAAGEGM